MSPYPSAAVTANTRSLLGLPALVTSTVLVAGAAASVATAAKHGFTPLGAALTAVALTGAAALLLSYRSRLRFERRLADTTRELEAGRREAEGREELLKALVEATPTALVFYSEVGRIVYANVEARRLFFEGQSPEGQNFLRLASQAPEALQRALLSATDELFTVELLGQPETYHVSRRTFPLAGELHTLLLVRHLTREVSRREVEVLKKVIRVISHELNNSLAPVASLVHSARLIARSPEHLPKLQQVFDTIEERTQHLTAFLNAYAQFARLPKPRAVAVQWAPFLERLGALYPEADMPSAPEQPGWFDPMQIEQLAINLLKNANEAGGAAGDVAFTLSADDSGVTFQVSDRGHGLSQEALESAFLPLYSTKERGSGLGLALCREIVEAHGGNVSIKNRDGGGCTVTCWLPGPKKPGPDAQAARARLTLTRA